MKPNSALSMMTMMMKIRFGKSAKKELRELQKSTRKRIIIAIRKLRNTPRPPGCKKLKGRDEYRIRVGDYRVLYEIHDDVLIVLVIRVAHRREVYH